MSPISFGQAQFPRKPRSWGPLRRHLLAHRRLDGYMWDLFRRRTTRRRRQGQPWPVGGPVEEGLSPRDRILPEGRESRLIETSREGGKRGSGWDVVRKRRCHFRVGAMDENIWVRQKQRVENNVSHQFLVFFFFVGSPVTWPQRC